MVAKGGLDLCQVELEVPESIAELLASVTDKFSGTIESLCDDSDAESAMEKAGLLGAYVAMGLAHMKVADRLGKIEGFSVAMHCPESEIDAMLKRAVDSVVGEGDGEEIESMRKMAELFIMTLRMSFDRMSGHSAAAMKASDGLEMIAVRQRGRRAMRKYCEEHGLDFKEQMAIGENIFGKKTRGEDLTDAEQADHDRLKAILDDAVESL